MFPLLRKAPSARIVNVSSGLGSITQNGDPAHPDAAAKFLGYSASKAALSFEKLDKHVVVGCGRASPRFQGGAYTTK